MSVEAHLRKGAADKGWEVAPVWTIARRVDRTGFPDAELLSVYRDWGVVRKADRDDNFNVESDDLSAYKRVLPGDLVLNKMKTWQGSLAVSGYEGIVSPAYFVCQLSSKVHPRFIHYLLRSAAYIAMYAAASKGIRPNQWDLPFDEFRSLPVLLPPLDEQRRIAGFLDSQVARIDALIATRSTEQSLTVEWKRSALSSLFQHGPVRKLRSLLLQGPCYGVLVPRFVENSGVPLIRVGDLTGLWDEERELARIEAGQSNEYARTVVSGGDVLVSVVGSIDKVAVVPEWRSGCNIARAVARLRPVNPDIAWAIQAWVQTDLYLDQARLSTGGDTAQPTLNMGDLSQFTLKLENPTKIANAARAIAEVQSDQAAALVRSIDLLSEYKRSLITAAVTGELDVTTASTGVPA